MNLRALQKVKQWLWEVEASTDTLRFVRRQELNLLNSLFEKPWLKPKGVAMTWWLTEREFRQSGAMESGITINVPFLKEIKEDSIPVRVRTRHLEAQLAEQKCSAKEALQNLAQYRDSLETYFALEEFYGYFNNAMITNPIVTPRASELRAEHAELFTMITSLIEAAEQLVYQEQDPALTLTELSENFRGFASRLESHEQEEMDLMMQLCNEEIGVGD